MAALRSDVVQIEGVNMIWVEVMRKDISAYDLTEV